MPFTDDYDPAVVPGFAGSTTIVGPQASIAGQFGCPTGANLPVQVRRDLWPTRHQMIYHSSINGAGGDRRRGQYCKHSSPRHRRLREPIDTN